MGVPLLPTGTESNKICDLEQINRRPLLKPSLFGRLCKAVLSPNKHFENLSVLVCVNFLIAGLGFFTRVKVANVLGKESFGLLAYGLALGSYGAVIVRCGLDRTLVRDLVHYPRRFGQLVAGSLALRGLLLVVVILALVSWKLTFASSELSWSLIAVVVGTSLMALDLRAVYDSWHKISRDAVYNLIQRCCYYALIWIVILFVPDKLSIGLIGVGIIVSAVLYLFMQQRWAFKRIEFYKAKESPAKAAIKLGFANLMVWAAAIGCLSFGVLNQLVLKYFKGTVELGGYAAAWQIVAIVMLLLNQVARIGKPATARITREGTDRNARRRFLVKYSALMFIAASPIAISSLFCPGLILKILFRPEYASEAGTLRILGIYVALFSLGLVASQYVIAARMEKLYFTSVIVGGVLSILFCILLIPKSGSMGAAMSLLIAHGISMGLYWIAMILHVRNRE
jgi:O-antigen/teichoic acid export membrane protein